MTTTATPITTALRQVRELVKARAAITLLPTPQRTALLAWVVETIDAGAAPERVLVAARIIGTALATRTLADVHTSHVDACVTYRATRGER